MPFYRVKKVKGKYYLVKEWWDPVLGKKRTVSLGNCEKIEELLKQNREKWCRGRDSNPGFPAPSPLRRSDRIMRQVFPSDSSRQVSPVKEYVLNPSAGKLRQFYLWLINVRKISEGTARDYLNYLQKPLNLDNKHSVYAYRLYLKFEGREIPEWMKPAKKPGVDLKVPSEVEILESIEYLRGNARPEYLQSYLLLLASGIRVKEAQLFLANLDSWESVERNGVRYYTVNWQRGTKAVFYIFTPSWLQLEKAAVNWKTNGPHRKVPVKPKYVRKFFATKCFELGLPAEIIDFLQGRTPRSILTQHYLNLLPRAVEEYRKYAEWLKGFLSQAGVIE